MNNKALYELAKTMMPHIEAEAFTPDVLAGNTVDYPITFDIPFEDIPVIVVNWGGSFSTTNREGTLVSTTDVTTTGATIKCYNTTTGARSGVVRWIAVEKTQY